MAFLLRTASGKFLLEDSYTIDEIKESASLGSVGNILISMEEALNQYGKVILSQTAYRRAINGNLISFEEILFADDLREASITRVFCENYFIGLGRIIPQSDKLIMEKVLV